ncbi:hypothetical protein E2P81_ATG08944 [Venturia nashicola]|uniref:Uncharacterized protein n=1 Tax=Venturia nashicola TaxID=86259 RepID=A0A4Z1NKG3_9PEZI|nr:hypothetical protein E6O75_ATG09143 [Venturia nashicola]TLD23600.1 hypothetical protein E2P81_ATG08944 [Venturia nashicola]
MQAIRNLTVSSAVIGAIADDMWAVYTWLDYRSLLCESMCVVRGEEDWSEKLLVVKSVRPGTIWTLDLDARQQASHETDNTGWGGLAINCPSIRVRPVSALKTIGRGCSGQANGLTGWLWYAPARWLSGGCHGPQHAIPDIARASPRREHVSVAKHTVLSESIQFEFDIVQIPAIFRWFIFRKFRRSMRS